MHPFVSIIGTGLGLAASAMVWAAPTAKTPAAKVAKTCLKELGKTKAELMVQQCKKVSLSSHPPCDVAHTCQELRDETLRGCQTAHVHHGDLPVFCVEYLKKPDEATSFDQPHGS